MSKWIGNLHNYEENNLSMRIELNRVRVFPWKCF